jgi:hypothetical protein
MATATQSRGTTNSRARGEEKQRPAWSKKAFPLSIAVFEFENVGDVPPNFSVKMQRTFRRDEESDWEQSEYLSGNDLLRAAKLLEEADAFVQSRLEAYYAERKKH